MPQSGRRHDTDLLFVNAHKSIKEEIDAGTAAITPYPMLSAMNAALRNWVHNVNLVLADKGVYAGNVAINVFISAHAPQTVPRADIAQIYWHLHTHRDQPEHLVTT